MKRIICQLFDPKHERIMAVPLYMQTIINDGVRFVVEGNPPDAPTGSVDRFIRIEFEFDNDGRLDRHCKLTRRYTASKKSFNAGRVRRSTVRANTSWVVPWMAEGF